MSVVLNPEATACLRDLKMDLARENFDKGQISEKEFEAAIQQADKVCAGCENPMQCVEK